MQRVNACFYLTYMGFSEYYCGQIKIFRDLKARNYLSFLKKDSSESYWVKKKKKYRNLIYSRKKQKLESRELILKFLILEKSERQKLIIYKNDLCLQQFSQLNS